MLAQTAVPLAARLALIDERSTSADHSDQALAAEMDDER
jgi:hypothetical protein